MISGWDYNAYDCYYHFQLINMRHQFYDDLDQTKQNVANHSKNESGFFKGENEMESEAATEEAVAVAPILTDTQVRDAIRYMRNAYPLESIRLLRVRFGLEENTLVDRDLVLAVAQYQDTNTLTVDGKLGPTSYNTIQAEGGEAMQDIVFFKVMSPLGGRMEMLQGSGLTSMVGHFFVEVRLPPGEDAKDYQYRQFICGRVEMLPATAAPTDPLTNLDTLYSNLPGGRLPPIPGYKEDGDTSIPSQYGHRENPGQPENHYLDENGHQNQRNGSIFKSWDRPGIIDRICQTGEQYEFDFRFRGEVRHKDRGVIATRHWSVKDDFVIP